MAYPDLFQDIFDENVHIPTLVIDAVPQRLTFALVIFFDGPVHESAPKGSKTCKRSALGKCCNKYRYKMQNVCAKSGSDLKEYCGRLLEDNVSV